MKVQMEIIPIHLSMVNVFAIRGARTVLVDSGNPGDETKILRALDKKGIAPQDISLIFITHGHTDHFGGLAGLRKLTSARVAISKEDAPALRTGGNLTLYPANMVGRVVKYVAEHVLQLSLPPLEPDIVINGEMDLSPYGVEGRLIRTAGHTAGSCSLQLAGGELFVGDFVSGRSINPRIPTSPFFCQNKDWQRESIQKVLDLKPTIIYAGHGGPFTCEVLSRAFGQ